MHLLACACYTKRMSSNPKWNNMKSQEHFDNCFPDPDTAVIRINGYQQRLFRKALQEFIQNNIGKPGSEVPFHEIEMAQSMEDMLNPGGSTGPLEAGNAVNSFVL